MDEESFERCMSFENHKKVLTQSIDHFLTRQAFVDMTLVCNGGKKIKVHRAVLAACSPLFESILIDINDQSHPVLVFSDFCESLMLRIVEFVYKGKTNVPRASAEVFLKVAKKLQIRGLENIFSQEDMPQVSGNSLNMSKSHKKRKLLSKESPGGSAKLDSSTQLQEKLALKIDTGTGIKTINPFAIKRLQKDSDSSSTEDDLCVPGPSKFNNGKEAVSSVASNLLDPVPQDDDSDIEFIEDNLNPSIVVVNDSQLSSTVHNQFDGEQWIAKEQINNKRTSTNTKSASDEYDSDDSEIRASHRKKKKNVDNLMSDFEESLKDEHTGGRNSMDQQHLSDSSESPELITPLAMEDLPRAMVDPIKQEMDTSFSETEYLQKPFDGLARYCVICKIFKKNIGLHVKRLHSQLIRKKEYVCKSCSKMFYMRHSLHIHKCIS